MRKRIPHILSWAVCLLTVWSVWAQPPNREAVLGLWQQAEKSMVEGNFEAAYAQSQNAFLLAKGDGWHEGMGSSLHWMARIANSQGNPERELLHLLELEAHHIQYSDRFDVYESLLKIAGFYKKERIFEPALEYYHRAGAALPPDDPYGAWSPLRENLADLHWEMENHDSIRWYHHEILNNYGEGDASEEVYYHRQRIADAWLEQGDFEAAVAEHQRIADLAKGRGDAGNHATAVNNIGIAYSRGGDYRKAVTTLEEAERICDGEPLVDLGVLYMNMGIAYHNAGDDKKAEEYLKKAIKDAPRGRDKAELQHTLANIYLNTGDEYGAKIQNDAAMSEARSSNDERLLAKTYGTAAEIHKRLYNYEEASEFREKELALLSKLNSELDKEKQRLLELKNQLGQTEKEVRLELAERESREQKRLSKEKEERLRREKEAEERKRLETESENLKLEAGQREKELALLEQERISQEAQLKNKELEAASRGQQLALAKQKIAVVEKQRELEESQRKQELQQIELKTAQEREQAQKDKLEAAQREQEIQGKLLEEQKRATRATRLALIIGGILSLLIIGLIFAFLMSSRRKNKLLAQQNEEIKQQRSELENSYGVIAKEREKSESLLLNILPAAIAAELKEKGAATPQQYESVTVLFTDFSQFTRLASNMPPEQLIAELNTCFKAFDDIAGRYGIEPIKTIGDAYMCAGGVPIVGSVEPANVVQAALEMGAFMRRRLSEKEAAGIPYWGTRIGVHTGPVVAGVVGRRKFAYDIWGDTVNVASRMESNAEVGTVNISHATYLLVKDQFQCAYRGEFKVKNRGVMKMYKVNEL